jgi:hypothetical protein
MQALLTPPDPPDVVLARAAAAKAKGNAAYAAGDWMTAINMYGAATYALRRLTPTGFMPCRAATAAEAAAGRALARDCDSNAAAAWLQLREGAPALSYAEAALDADGDAVKARQRRAQALQMLGMPRAAALVDPHAATDDAASSAARPARCMALCAARVKCRPPRGSTAPRCCAAACMCLEACCCAQACQSPRLRWMNGARTRAASTCPCTPLRWRRCWLRRVS